MTLRRPAGGIRIAVLSTVAAVLSAGLLVLATLNSLYFQKFLLDTQQARLFALAFDARDALNRAVALGLPLEQFDGRRRILEDLHRVDPGLIRSYLFAAGASGFNDLESAAELPADWQAAMLRSPRSDGWPINDATGFGVLVPITNSFETQVGVLAVLTATEVLQAPRQGFDRFLFQLSLLVGIPAAILLIFLTYMIIGPPLRRLPVWFQYARALERAARDGSVLPAEPAPATSASARLMDALVAEPLALLRADLQSRRTQP